MKSTVNQKKLVSVHGPGSNHWVGDGFPVKNYFPSTGVQREVSPFLMLDYAAPFRFEPSPTPRGVGEHPHRGFETVTLSFEGSVEHRDSAGHSGVIHAGDVQWMTAGSGVVHEEMHEREFAKNGGTFEMVQLWVNLPKAHKMTTPKYQTITNEQIPSVQLDEKGSYARVVAGSLNGVSGPARTFTPVTLLDVRLASGSVVTIKLTSGHNTCMLVRAGDVTVGGGEQVESGRLAVLGKDGDELSLQSQSASEVLIMSGEPINEPIFAYGPFVMNTKSEIVQAVEDYQAGRMGHLS